MKIGDLVRCKHVPGKPVGVVVSEPRHGINVSSVDVLVTTGSGSYAGRVLPFRICSLEIVK